MSTNARTRRAPRWYAGAGLAAGALAASAPVIAQQSGLEEIVVTARFREENLQQTPLAITAFTGENMEARNLTDVTMLDSFSPNTIIAPLGAGWGSTMAAFIRGVGAPVVMKPFDLEDLVRTVNRILAQGEETP